MKHNQNNRRQRPRGNGRRYPNQKGGSFESTGPEAKVRGTAQQVLEKYQALARDAYSAGDRILAEGYLQHAEHYYRIISLENESTGRDNNRPRQNNGDDDMDNDDQNDDQNYNDHRGGQRGNGANRGNGHQANSNQPAHREDVPIKSGEETAEVTATPEPTADVKSAEPAPRKPRARRPRKTEQPAAETTESSAAD